MVTKQPSEPTECQNAQCDRALARPVEYCPYCGTSTAEADERIPPRNEITEPKDVKPSADAAEVQQSKSEHVSEASVANPVHAPEPVQRNQDPVPKPIPVSRVLLSALALIAAATIYYLTTSTPSARTVEIDASPTSWLALDLSGFTDGDRILIRADGPFRLRSSTTSPILVGGVNAVDIGSLGHSGVEVKSATERAVHIEVVLTRS